MTEKKVGMLGNKLQRKSGNFTPEEIYDKEIAGAQNNLIKEHNKEKQTFINSTSVIKSNERKNQQAQLKISQSLKDEINAIKTLTNTKYEYEVIQLLIDGYKKTLSPEDLKKLRLIIDLNIG